MFPVKSLHALTISTSEQAAVGAKHPGVHKILELDPELSRKIPYRHLLASLLASSVPFQNLCLLPVDRWVETDS